MAELPAAALRDHPDLHIIAVVPRHPDNDGQVTRMPGLMARHDVIRACAAAGGDRFAVCDLENRQGTPVYVPAKVVVVDDVRAMIGRATPLYRIGYDPDGRPWRDRLRGRV